MRVFCCVFLILLVDAREFSRQRPSNVRESKDRVIPRKIEDEEESLNVDLPVPFGHIYKEGFANTLYGIKQPVDFLEYEMRVPKTLKEAQDLLDHADPSRLQFFADSKFISRSSFKDTERDRIMEKLGARYVPDMKNKTFIWNDFGENLERNFAMPPLRSSQVGRNRVASTAVEPPPQPPPYKSADDIPVGPVKYADLFNPPKKQKFTTCDEFGKDAYFHPNDVINLQWIPFYIWSPEPSYVSIPYTFSYVTKKFTSEYKEIYKNMKQIEWQRPKLLMKGRGEFLIIAADKKGLFHALQIIQLPENFQYMNFTLPYTTIRLKIMDPYLILMFCKRDYAVIMAVDSNVPPTDKEKVAEAETVDFKGSGMPVTLDRNAEKRRKKLEQRDDELEKESMRHIPRVPFGKPQQPLEDRLPQDQEPGPHETFL